MSNRAMLLLSLACAAPLSGADAGDLPAITTPSGLTVTFLDVITDAPGLGLAYRFRFLAPDLDPDMDYMVAEGDMAHLCRSYALPRLPEIGPQPSQVVITLSTRAIPFGDIAPDVVQFFEVYAPENDDCVWQAF